MLQEMEDIPNTACNSQHSSLYAVCLFCPVYPFLVPPIPQSILYLFSPMLSISLTYGLIRKTSSSLNHSSSRQAFCKHRCTQAFLKFTISLHTLGNVARWQTVFVVGVGRCWSSFFFFFLMCVVRGGTNGALNQTQGGTHHPARRLNLQKYPPTFDRQAMRLQPGTGFNPLRAWRIHHPRPQR